MGRELKLPFNISRREFVQSCATGLAFFAAAPAELVRGISSGELAVPSGAASRVLPLDQDWIFAGRLNEQALQPGFC
jgi:hypothetical protein